MNECHSVLMLNTCCRCREVTLWFSWSFSRSRCRPSVIMARGWSRRCPGSRSARSSSAACAPWALLTSWRWPPTLRAATSSRPSSPHPATKGGARSSGDWRYEYKGADGTFETETISRSIDLFGPLFRQNKQFGDVTLDLRKLWWSLSSV